MTLPKNKCSTVSSARPSGLRLWTRDLLRFGEISLAEARPIRSLAVGRARYAALPRLLQGLRRGTCHVVARLNRPGDLLIGRFGDNECSWYLDLPEGSGAWAGGGTFSASLNGRAITVRGGIDDGDISDDEPGWSVGRVDTLSLGDAVARADWITATTATGFEEQALTIDGHNVTLTLDPLQRTDIRLSAAQPVDAEAAAQISGDLMWLLHLASPTKFEPLATWDSTGAEGIVKFGNIDRSLNHQLLLADGVAPFLGAATNHWSARSEEERKVLRVVIDLLLVSCKANLEPSIALTSSALELIAEEWLPAEKGQYDVPKTARKAIKATFVAGARQHVPGTEFAADAAMIGDWLFNHVTKQRFRAILDHFEIPADDDGVKHFVNMRNAVVHGGFQIQPRSERMRAKLFGQWMLGTTIVRRLGYQGLVIDWRRKLP